MDNQEEKNEAATEETAVGVAAETDAETRAETDAEQTQAEPETLEEVKTEIADEDEKTDRLDPLRVSGKGVKLAAEPNIDPDKKPNFICLYIAIAVFALGVVSLALAIGLAFVVTNVGIYFLVGSMVAELAAISFCNAQKQNGQHKLTKVFKVLSYVVLFAAVIIFAVGTSISATNK